MMQSQIIIKKSKKLTPKEKYNQFISANISYKTKTNKELNRENVFDYYNGLSFEQKKVLTVYDLNIIYYYMNSLFKKYISNKEDIFRIIESCTSMKSQHSAFMNINAI